MSGAELRGPAVVDAGVVIGHLDTSDAHHHAATAALAQVAGTATRLLLPATAYAEVLVHPFRVGAAEAAQVDAALAAIPIDVAALERSAARRAAQLRAEHRSLRLPDACVIATAVEAGAVLLCTTDRGWPGGLVESLAPALQVLTVS
ncbi:PIN domain-containing protein [Candidatus Poriferisodalis sp.]|uniref:PIN domain-containing protein n=1 Tax=Candidatus Poriferisodalis sp. TaxID=3101277 RepID=UPI003B01DAB4